VAPWRFSAIVTTLTGTLIALSSAAATEKAFTRTG
jgi:hypothetical protein